MQTDLIIGTAYEEMAKKLNQESRYMMHSLENEVRLRNIVKEVVAVYYYLRCQFGISHRELSLEEFQTAQDYLKEQARHKINTRWQKFLKSCGILSPWAFFLVNGYFRLKYAPNFAFPDDFYCKWYKSHPWHGDNYYNFDVEKINSDFFAVPPNYKNLARQILEERLKEVGSGN